MGNADLGPIQITKITSFLSKALNSKFHGNDSIQITVFKHPHLPTGILQETAMQ